MSQTNDCVPLAVLTQALQLSEVLGPSPWSILGVAFFKLLIHGTMLFSICWYLFLPNLVHCLYFIWIFILITMFPYFYLLIFLFSLLKFVVPTFFTPFSYCTYLFSLFHFYQLFASSHFFPNHCLPTSWQNHLLQTRKPHSLIHARTHPYVSIIHTIRLSLQSLPSSHSTQCGMGHWGTTGEIHWLCICCPHWFNVLSSNTFTFAVHIANLDHSPHMFIVTMSILNCNVH